MREGENAHGKHGLMNEKSARLQSEAGVLRLRSREAQASAEYMTEYAALASALRYIPRPM